MMYARSKNGESTPTRKSGVGQTVGRFDDVIRQVVGHLDWSQPEVGGAVCRWLQRCRSVRSKSRDTVVLVINSPVVLAAIAEMFAREIEAEVAPSPASTARLSVSTKKVQSSLGLTAGVFVDENAGEFLAPALLCVCARRREPVRALRSGQIDGRRL